MAESLVYCLLPALNSVKSERNMIQLTCALQNHSDCHHFCCFTGLKHGVCMEATSATCVNVLSALYLFPVFFFSVCVFVSGFLRCFWTEDRVLLAITWRRKWQPWHHWLKSALSWYHCCHFIHPLWVGEMSTWVRPVSREAWPWWLGSRFWQLDCPKL